MSIGNHTTSNDITGDPIQTKQLSAKGRKNWDKIDWGARAREKAEQEKEHAGSKTTNT